MNVRDLHTLEDFSNVVDLQRRVWGDGYDDIVPLSIFAVSVKRGGILIGAFHEGQLAAFVYSLPGLKHGQPMQWSHMLGVDEAYRRSGIGYRLKLAQRERALAQGLDLIEWTYDPLQVPNAHLNFARLGVVAEEYLENVYGMSGSALHQGAPTDRFIAAWHIASPHVARRLEQDASRGDATAAGRAPTSAIRESLPHPTPGANSDAPDGAEDAMARVNPGARRATLDISPDVPSSPGSHLRIVARDASVAHAPVVNETREEGPWLAPAGEPDLERGEARLLVEIPARFGEMLHQAPTLALDWRMVVRRIFTTYFARGYRCVDFLLDRERGRGRYLLVRRTDD